ncbi:hypothetical protein [Streptomyces sp. NPDC006997]|uniref:hypothetical protein n=1 Tax=Streptomyces sp. NPDC006997 TaxID=3155356 RepID=UPI0033ECA874
MSAALTIAFLLLTASGCGAGESERKYAVPDSLCEISVGADDLAAFLPSGNKLRVQEEEVSGIKTCEVIVDRTVVASAMRAWEEEMNLTAYAVGLSQEPPTRSARNGRFVYSGRSGFGKTQGCTSSRYRSDKGDHVLYTSIQMWTSKHQDADAMKRLIISYTEEVEKSAECAR